MNKVSDRNKRTLIIVGLCAVLIFMAVGYAAFSQFLTINGTSSISSNWCLGFDNTKLDTFTPTKGVETGTSPSGEIVYSGTACGSKYVPTATLNTTLNQPGDKVEYTLTIKNAGSINAAIKSITVDGDSVTSNTTKTKGNVKYIVEMPETTTLAKGAETTMKVTVSFQDDTNITGSYTGERQSMPILINAEEDDGEGGMVVTEPKLTGTIYRWSTKHIYNNMNLNKYVLASDSVGMGPSDVFDTVEDCNTKYSNTGDYYCQLGENALGEYTTDAGTLGKTYYLKHDVNDDIITNSYVCFVYNNAEHCMKGGDGGASFAANTQMIQEYQTFYSLNNVFNPSSSNPGCDFDSSYSKCYGGGFDRVYADSGGYVGVYGSSSVGCYVYSDGHSNCSE